MTISLSTNVARQSYAVAQGATQSAFTVSFAFFDDDDLNVFVDGTLKTLTTHYTVSGGDGSAGSVTMTSGNEVTGISGGSTVVITRDIDLDRTTDFPSSGPFAVATLNTELDKITAQFADRKDVEDRAIRLKDQDETQSMELPLKADRLGKVLGFNATTGAVEAGPTIADTQSLAAISADIASLADIEDGTTATDAISGLAAIKANVTSVAAIASNVTSVAGNASNINTVAGDATDIGTVAGISSNITTVAGIASNVTSVAGKATEVGRLGTADAVSDMNTLGTSSNVTNMNTLAAIASDITTTAGVASSISASGTNASNAASSATAAASSATAAASSATAAAASQTAAAASAASAASAFDSFDDRFLGSKTSNPSTDNDGDALVTGALYFNSTANEMRVYDGANWIAATSAGNVSLIVYEYTATAGQTTFSGSDNNSATLSYTADNLQVVMNGIILDPSDFTATNGTSVVLASGAALNDLVNIYAFKSFTTADMVSKTAGGTFSGAVGFSGGITGDVPITGHASIGVNAVNSARALTVAGATDGSSSTILQLYNSSLSSKFSVRDDGFVDVAGTMTITTDDNSPQLTLVSTDADASRGPELLLYRNSASPANGDALGFIRWDGENDSGAQHEYIKFEASIASSSGAATGSEQGRLDIRTMVSGTDRSRIDIDYDGIVINQDNKDLDFRVESDVHDHQFFVRGSDGFVGVGTSAPNAPLEVNGTSTNDNIGTFYVNNGNTANNSAIAAFATAATNTSTSNVLIRFGSSGYAAGQGMITAAGGGAAAFAAFSDRALKENIADLPSQLANIMALRPVEFDYIKSQGGEHQIGFVAQEVEEIYPDLVGENEDGMKMLGGLDKTSARLVKALQEAVAKIEALETRVATLEAGE